MKLRQLLRGLQGIEIRGSQEVVINGLTTDSRTVAPGNLFIARRGEQHDGRQFIGAAIQAGAVAIVTDWYDPFLDKTQILCEAPGQLEAKIAARYYRNPSDELFVVGMTGTKGKTTTSYLVHHLLEGLGVPTGLVGTVETIIRDRRAPSRLTTHDATTNQKRLREMVDQGCKAAVLEVSSHGLEQGRVDAIAFDMALFTNLSPDHLDYHQTIENYAAAKRKLFEQCEGTVIVNQDSPWAPFMCKGKRAVTFGLEEGADVRGRNIHSSVQGTEVWVDDILFKTSLQGKFNVYNLLGAIAIGVEWGVPLAQIAEIFSHFQHVPGRLERIPNSRGIQLFVDYAHTGESLESVLSTLREVVLGKIFLVFGCGGNRDPARRQAMGAVAAKGADFSIVTTDNPRNEDPEEIARQILFGFGEGAATQAILEPDRTKAIARAIHEAKEGDCVLIAGKGHEKTQIFAHQTIPFDDVAVAKSFIHIA